MYESPINLIMDQMYDKFETDLENRIFSATRSYNIDIDKEQLIAALNYDRDQYDKGFADGYEKGLAESKESIKEEILNLIMDKLN